MVRKYRVTNCQGYSKRYTKRFQRRKKALLVFLIPRDNMPVHKNAVVYEEHWPADYPKLIYYGKEQPRDFF